MLDLSAQEMVMIPIRIPIQLIPIPMGQNRKISLVQPPTTKERPLLCFL